MKKGGSNSDTKFKKMKGSFSNDIAQFYEKIWTFSVLFFLIINYDTEKTPIKLHYSYKLPL